MFKLSELVNRKFIESIDISEWEIETENGFVDIISSNKTIEYEVYSVVLENGLELKCADTHILIDETNNEVFAKDSLGINLKTKLGISKVIDVKSLDYSENMYDLSINSEDHTYYTNDILSHNTITSAAYILWYTLFQDNKTVAVVANKEENARETLSRYQLMYEYLPIWMQQGIKTWNKGDIELENGSKVRTSATSVSGLRSKSISLLYIDECGILATQIAEQFFAATYPVISSGKTSKILMTSTPLGYNHFWKFWNDAQQGRNDFVPFTVPYWKVPGRDEKWAEEQRRLLGEVKFNQEVLCHFLGSTNTLIRSDVIGSLSYVPPIYSAEGLDLYEMPEYEHIYTIVVDIAKGVGGDYSAFVVIDVTQVPYRVVGKYRDNMISPLLFPTFIFRVAKEYNDAYVLCEINSSDQVPHILYEEYEYENILFITRDSRGQKVSSGFGGQNMQYGVTTDKKTKRIGCFNFKSLLEERKLLVFDADIISEISTFVEKRGSYEADDGYHDDLVINLVLFGWLTTNSYFKELTDVNLRKLMYEKRIKEIEEEMLPVGYLNDGNKVDIQETVEDGDVWAPFNKEESPFKVPSSYLTDRI